MSRVPAQLGADGRGVPGPAAAPEAWSSLPADVAMHHLATGPTLTGFDSRGVLRTLARLADAVAGDVRRAYEGESVTIVTDFAPEWLSRIAALLPGGASVDGRRPVRGVTDVAGQLLAVAGPAARAALPAAAAAKRSPSGRATLSAPTLHTLWLIRLHEAARKHELRLELTPNGGAAVLVTGVRLHRRAFHTRRRPEGVAFWLLVTPEGALRAAGAMDSRDVEESSA